MLAYPQNTIMEVQANDASSQSEILLEPVSYFLLNDALCLWAGLNVVTERQKSLSRHLFSSFNGISS